jgi:hypothetical protein
MDGVEPAVVRIIRIEDETDEAICVASQGGQLMKYAGLPVVPVEVQVGSEGPGIPVEDVQWAIQIVDEESVLVLSWLLMKKIDSREIHSIHAVTGPCIGDGHGGVVLNLDG